METTTNPIGFLNSLRGIAAWMVCMYHCAFILTPLFPNWLPVFDWGQEGVYVFFVISGVILPWSLSQGNYNFKSIDRFMLKRIIRLYPPFIISAIIYLISIWLSKKNPSIYDFEMVQMFIDTVTFQAPFKESKWIIDMYWTLFVEFQFYIYLALIFPFLGSKRIGVRLAAYWGTLGLTYFSTYFHGPHCKENLFFHLPVFTLGFSLFLLFRLKISKIEFWSGVVGSLLIEFLNTDVRMQIGSHILIVAGLTFLSIYLIKRGPKWLNFLGDISYSYYLIHFIFISTINGFFYKMAPSGTLFLIIFLLIQLFSISAAWVMYRFIEKPSLALTKKIRYRA